MHKATTRFRKLYKTIPEHVQKIARKNFELLKTDPLHPSLHFKKVGNFWSVRIGVSYRALAVKDAQDFIWVWIGSHSEYEQMIKDMG